MTGLNVMRNRANARDRDDQQRNQALRREAHNEATVLSLVARAQRQAELRALAGQYNRHANEQDRLTTRESAIRSDPLTQADTNLGDWRKRADQNIHRTPTGQWATKDNK